MLGTDVGYGGAVHPETFLKHPTELLSELPKVRKYDVNIWKQSLEDELKAYIKTLKDQTMDHPGVEGAIKRAEILLKRVTARTPHGPHKSGEFTKKHAPPKGEEAGTGLPKHFSNPSHLDKLKTLRPKDVPESFRMVFKDDIPWLFKHIRGNDKKTLHHVDKHKDNKGGFAMSLITSMLPTLLSGLLGKGVTLPSYYKPYYDKRGGSFASPLMADAVTQTVPNIVKGTLPMLMGLAGLLGLSTFGGVKAHQKFGKGGGAIFQGDNKPWKEDWRFAFPTLWLFKHLMKDTGVSILDRIKQLFGQQQSGGLAFPQPGTGANMLLGAIPLVAGILGTVLGTTKPWKK